MKPLRISSSSADRRKSTPSLASLDNQSVKAMDSEGSRGKDYKFYENNSEKGL